MGSSTTYSAVIKPALPGVVYCRPYCWKGRAEKQHHYTAGMPPAASTPAAAVFRQAVGLLLAGLCSSRQAMTGSSTRAPRNIRAQLNVKGAYVVHAHGLGHKRRAPDQCREQEHQIAPQFFSFAKSDPSVL